MLVSDFKKIICNIDNHLYVEVGDGLPAMIKVKYSLIDDDSSPVMIIGINGDLDTCNRGFQLISNKNKRKLLLASVDMAMTPLHKRVENKWNVIVGDDRDSSFPFLVWAKNIDKNTIKFRLKIAGTQELEYAGCIFTDSEYKELIEHIKTLPDGDWQAKVAEHGKTEVKSIS